MLIQNLIKQSRFYILVHHVFFMGLFLAFRLSCRALHLINNKQSLWIWIVFPRTVVFIYLYQRCQGVLVTSQVHARV